MSSATTFVHGHTGSAVAESRHDASNVEAAEETSVRNLFLASLLFEAVFLLVAGAYVFAGVFRYQNIF